VRIFFLQRNSIHFFEQCFFGTKVYNSFKLRAAPCKRYGLASETSGYAGARACYAVCHSFCSACKCWISLY